MSTTTDTSKALADLGVRIIWDERDIPREIEFDDDWPPERRQEFAAAFSEMYVRIATEIKARDGAVMP